MDFCCSRVLLFLGAADPRLPVCAEYTGCGLARALHDYLLDSRFERRSTLLVEPDNDRAYRAYVNWGWSRVGVTKPSWPGAPTFDVLIRDLSRPDQ